MRKNIPIRAVIGLGALACFLGAMFAATRLPFMEVVRRNLQSRIDADAYFYSEVSGFGAFEKSVTQKRR